MTIYHAHGKYFLPLEDDIREVSFSQISEWESEGIQILIKEGELID